jgi:hypothetical protein
MGSAITIERLLAAAAESMVLLRSRRRWSRVELPTMRRTAHVCSQLYDTVLHPNWHWIVGQGSVAADASFVWLE